MNADDLRRLAENSAAEQAREAEARKHEAEERIQAVLSTERQRARNTINSLDTILSELAAKAKKGEREAVIYVVPSWVSVRGDTEYRTTRVTIFGWRYNPLRPVLDRVLGERPMHSFDVPDFAQSVFDACQEKGLNPTWQFTKPNPFELSRGDNRHDEGPARLGLLVRW